MKDSHLSAKEYNIVVLGSGGVGKSALVSPSQNALIRIDDSIRTESFHGTL